MGTGTRTNFKSGLSNPLMVLSLLEKLATVVLTGDSIFMTETIVS